MTKTERTKLKRLIRKLEDCQRIADELELLAGNGGELGAWIGATVEELEDKLRQAT